MILACRLVSTSSVHCKVSQRRVSSTLKGWKPHLNHNHCQQPGRYHEFLSRYRTKNPPIAFDNLESALLHAGFRGGNSRRDILHFCPSPQLQSLRRARRTTFDAENRKSWSLQIRKFQQREAKSWKSEQLQLKLGRMVRWKSLRGIDDRIVGRRIPQQPWADNFANMVQTPFDGKPPPPRHLDFSFFVISPHCRIVFLFFSSLLFPAVSLSPRRFYWSISGLPGFLLGVCWGATGIGGVERCFGEHLAGQRLISLHIGVAGATLSEQAGREGVHGGVAEQSGP